MGSVLAALSEEHAKVAFMTVRMAVVPRLERSVCNLQGPSPHIWVTIPCALPHPCCTLERNSMCPPTSMLVCCTLERNSMCTSTSMLRIGAHAVPRNLLEHMLSHAKHSGGHACPTTHWAACSATQRARLRDDAVCLVPCTLPAALRWRQTR